MSLPSGVGMVSSLSPAIFSGAPPSSTWMWAVSAHTTAPQRLVSACNPVTLAPVPLNTGYVSVRGPKCSRMVSARRAV